MLFDVSELEFIKFLHQHRTPLLDYFFKFLNFFDRPEFFFILVPALWLGHHWKAGVRLFYILFFSTLTNCSLKEFFLYPRPFHLDPTIGLIQVSGYGLPSGAAQSAILLAGLLLHFTKSKWRWVLALGYIFFISLSRLYLGVHFLSDILVGWALGFLFWMLFIYVRPYVEKQFEKLGLPMLFLISQIIPLILMYWQYSGHTIQLCAVAMSVGSGLFISNYYNLTLIVPKKSSERVLRAVIGILGAFICYGLTMMLPVEQSKFFLFVQFFLLGLWLSIGGNLLCRKILPNYMTILSRD